jgi:hypothetical protein
MMNTMAIAPALFDDPGKCGRRTLLTLNYGVAINLAIKAA